MMTIRGVLSLCHDFQDLDVMVKNIGYVPVVDPQWDRGRIAFKDSCLFASAVTALSAERRGASGQILFLRFIFRVSHCGITDSYFCLIK